MTGVAVVGAGNWGKNLVRNFSTVPGAELRWVVDVNEKTRAAMARQYPQARVAGDLEAALGDAGVQAVVIAVDAPLHYKIARQALEAGKHVYVEKPLTLAAADAQELIDLARERNLRLMVGHLLEYHPAVGYLKDMIMRGAVGEPLYLYFQRVNLGVVRKSENAWWSLAPHDVSVACYLFGAEPVSVSASGQAYLQKGVEDVVFANLKFADGRMAHIHVSWLDPHKIRKVTLVGSQKMAVFDDMDASEKIRVYDKGADVKRAVDYIEAITLRTGDILIPQVPAGEPLTMECKHFIDCVANGAEPRSDGLDGLRVVKVLEAGSESLARGGAPVALAHVGRAASAGVLQPHPHATPVPAQEPPMPPSDLPYSVHASAVVDAGAQIGEGTKVWHFCHVCSGAKIGRKCILGQNVFVADGVQIGNNCKIQNNVSIYTGTVLEDDVFLGPSCVLTNVTNPRSQVLRHSLYERIVLRRGASVGANATLVCGIEIGPYAFVAAGAVVARNVPDYALVMGVPARQAGWISRHGHRLTAGRDGIMVCPESGFRYREVSPGVVRCLDLDEQAPLPAALSQGERSYDEFKTVMV